MSTPPVPASGPPSPGQPRPVPDFKDVFPYLNPPKWDGKATCLCRPLLKEDRMPCVSFGTDLINGIGMIMTRTACEQGFTLDKVEPVAVKNLAARTDRPEWQANEVPWDGTTRIIYSRSGDERTASDLLDPSFLAAMHVLMDCQDVVMAIPVSTMMIACPRDMAKGLSPVAEQQYADQQSQGQEVLTPLLLSVIDGAVCGFFDLETTEDFPARPDAEPM